MKNQHPVSGKNMNDIAGYITFGVTYQEIEDIWSTAITGEISPLWITGIKIADYPPQYPEIEFPSWGDYLSHGARLLILTEDGQFSLTRDLLRHGIAIWKRSLRNPIVDPPVFDAVEADKVLQYALFGELFYG